MDNFHNIINKYINLSKNLNDKRIMKEAINIIESETVILDDEIEILNEIFKSLKENYTINIIQDPTNLDFCLAIMKQQLPIIKNSHELTNLLNEIKSSINISNKNTTKLETIVLNFLEASEHIEENEILLIQNIIRYLNNDWILKPFENQKYLGENIKISRLVPTYSKKLIKNK